MLPEAALARPPALAWPAAALAAPTVTAAVAPPAIIPAPATPLAALELFPDGVALGAAGVAALALLLALVALLQVRRVRADQRVVLGGAAADVVGHAAGLQRAFEELHARVEETGRQVEERVGAVEHRLDGAIAYRALVRYDAYDDLAGNQSHSLALLDAEHSGVVLTSIIHRDTARFYCKRVLRGEGEHPLSPEETEAVRLALAGEQRSVTLE